MKATCHCGDVSVEIERAPDYVNFCDCSLCRKMGGVWSYFPQAEVEIIGETQAYRRADYPEPAVEMHRCQQCGAVTHWILTEHFPGDKVGVNMRLFAPDQLAGIEARTLDGHNWFGEGDPKHRRAVGIMGTDVFI